MRVLVTGAAGLLGGAVVADLLASGHAVTALDRVEAASIAGARFVRDDLSARERLEELLSSVEAVVHCAAYPTPHAAREDVVFNGNVQSTANLLFAAEAAGVVRFVYASSQSALGLAYAQGIVAPDRVPVTEAHPCRPGEGYALSKCVGEALCRMVSERSSLATRCLRFPVIWAPERFAEHVAKRLGDPAQAARSQWAYIDVRDAAKACRLALAERGPAHAAHHVAAPWPFACTPDAVAAAYGAVPRAADWAPDMAVFATERDDLGFRATWRWTPDGIENVEPSL